MCRIWSWFESRCVHRLAYSITFEYASLYSCLYVIAYTTGVVNNVGKFRVDTPGRGVLAVKVVGPANEARPVITVCDIHSYASLTRLCAHI